MKLRKKFMSILRLYDYKDLLYQAAEKIFRTRVLYTNFFGLTSRYSAIRFIAIREGFLLPRSRSEIYVLSNPISRANFSWLIPFSLRIFLNFLPNSIRTYSKSLFVLISSKLRKYNSLCVY